MKNVAINASGGGADTGVKGNNIVEKDITMKIANIIRNNLESKGVNVVMMREDDETISYDARINKIKNKFGNSKDVIVISNTLNSGGSGIEVIYPLSKNDTLPKSIVNNLEYFNDVNSYQYRWPTDTTKDYYYITRNTPGYETIIVRYGHVSDIGDANIIKNDYAKMAEAVSDAILDYIGLSNESTYIVAQGDTLYSIAKKYNTTVNDLKELNKLNTNNLTIGQKIKIPETNSSQTPETEAYYKVISGDTLYSIAKKFNTTVDNLKELNNLKTNLISIGMPLKITGNKTHQVVSGDSLYSIARKYNTTVDNLKKINNLKTNLIHVGDILYIP